MQYNIDRLNNGEQCQYVVEWLMICLSEINEKEKWEKDKSLQCAHV